MSVYYTKLGKKTIGFGSDSLDTTTGVVTVTTDFTGIDSAFAWPLNSNVAECAYCVPDYDSTASSVTIKGYDKTGAASTATAAVTVHFIIVGH